MKYLFIDRDGTIIKDVPYSADVTKIEFMPGAIEGLKLFKEHSYDIIIVTNQSGIARGNFTVAEYYNMEFTLYDLLMAQGIHTVTLYCPHHPEGTVTPYNRICTCRKPATGLIDMYPERTDSLMIGDKDTDIQAGNASNLPSYLVTDKVTILDIAKSFFQEAEAPLIKPKRKYVRKIKLDSATA